MLASGGLLALVLLVVWWSQQTRRWFRVVVATFLAAFAFTFASIYLFDVPPHFAGCPVGCPGWRGYPLPVALSTQTGQTQIGMIDFGLNLLLLWLLILVASLVVQIMARALGWEQRNLALTNADHPGVGGRALGLAAAVSGTAPADHER